MTTHSFLKTGDKIKNMTTYTIYPIPNEVRGSEYLNLLHTSIEGASSVDIIFRIKKFSWRELFFSRPKQNGHRLIHIHWETNIYGSKFVFVSLVRMVTRFPALWLLKLRGVKIIWTMHNLYAHDYPHPRIDALGRFFMWHLVDTVTIQQEKITQKEIAHRSSPRIVFIQHPNFVGVFGPLWEGDREGFRNKLGIRPEEKVLLAVGSVRPYKELPALIDAVSEAYAKGAKVRLLIAGKASKEYGDTIIQKAGNNPAVILQLGFVEMKDMSSLLALSDYSILYYGDSSLNSGPLILSLSYGVPVITRDMPASEIITKENGFIFHDAKELENILLKLASVPPFDRDAIIGTSGPDWPTMAQQLRQAYVELWSENSNK